MIHISTVYDILISWR